MTLMFQGSKTSLEAKRAELIERGVPKDTVQGYYEFTCYHSFGSTSTASGVVWGRSTYVRTECKNESGITLKELGKKD